MNGQLSCEGPQGTTTLKEIRGKERNEVLGPLCRDLPKKVDPATINMFNQIDK